MKRGFLLLGLLGILVSTTAYGVRSPFDTWITKIWGEVRITGAGKGYIREQPNSAVYNSVDDENLFGMKIARFVYDVANDGGTSGNTYDLGVDLPAGAVITRSYMKVITQFTGTGTTALMCEDAGNIKAAVSFVGTAANTFIEGESTGAASAFQRDIAADCDISAVIAGGSALTAGKLLGWVQYVVED